MLSETEAIVLRTYKLAEADKIAVCMTRNFGIVRGVARGSRRTKSRFGASLEPFTRINLTFFEKEGSELVYIKGADILQSLFHVASNTSAISALGYLSELIFEFSQPLQADPRIYRMAWACFEAISESPGKSDGVVGYFELWILKLTGFLPDMKRCGACRKDLEDGGAGRGITYSAEGVLFCHQCGGGQRSIPPGAYRPIRAIHRLKPGEWAQEEYISLTPKERSAFVEFTRRLVISSLEKRPGTLQNAPQA